MAKSKSSKNSALRIMAACCCLIIGVVIGYYLPVEEQETTKVSSPEVELEKVKKRPTPMPILNPDEPYNERAFNPNDDDKGCAALIIEKIHGAQHRIYFALYSFRHKKIGDAMIAALKRGVKVDGIIDCGEYKRGWAPQIDRLKQEGARIQFDAQSGKGHDKYTVIDEKNTLFGSFNYDDGPSEKSFNNVFCRGNDAATANTYIDDWLKKRKKARDHIDRKRERAKQKQQH
jgi:phosphatidylserine/phosphatidylglycerophosphate/cardiolipin synthase-like enzyme